MISLAESDDELALIVGHELAHNTLRHRGKQTKNTILGALAGLAVDVAAYELSDGWYNPEVTATEMGGSAGALAYSQAFELEADYVEVYYTARAGYNVSNAAQLMRRIAVKNPQAIHANAGSTHPSTVERFVGIQNAAEEIALKRAAEMKLVPEFRK